MCPSINIPTITISTITGKIYGIIESLTDVIEELDKGSLSAQMRNLEGINPSHEPMASAHRPMDSAHEPIIAPHEPMASAHEPTASAHEPIAPHGPIAPHEPMDSAHEPMASAHRPMDSAHEPIAPHGPMASAHGPTVPAHEPVDPPEKGAEGKVFDLFRYLTGNEGLELVRLESTRQSLLRAQGFLEEKKQVLIRLARSREAGREISDREISDRSIQIGMLYAIL